MHIQKPNLKSATKLAAARAKEKERKRTRRVLNWSWSCRWSAGARDGDARLVGAAGCHIESRVQRRCFKECMRGDETARSNFLSPVNFYKVIVACMTLMYSSFKTNISYQSGPRLNPESESKEVRCRWSEERRKKPPAFFPTSVPAWPPFYMYVCSSLSVWKEKVTYLAPCMHCT